MLRKQKRYILLHLGIFSLFFSISCWFISMAAGEGSVPLGSGSALFPMMRSSFSHQSCGAFGSCVPTLPVSTGRAGSEGWWTEGTLALCFTWGGKWTLFYNLFWYACYGGVHPLPTFLRDIQFFCCPDSQQPPESFGQDPGFLRREWLHSMAPLPFFSNYRNVIAGHGIASTQAKWRGELGR